MRFDDWQLIFRDTSDSTTVNPDNIEVTALNDDGLDPGPGPQFDIVNHELSVTGEDIDAHIDFQFGFHVSVLDPLDPIEGAPPDGSNFLHRSHLFIAMSYL